MAIYRCEIKAISRKDGRNIVASAAYRAGVILSDICDFFTKANKRHDYSRKQGVVTAGIILPALAPKAFADRQTLWNAQERAENRKNSRVAREALIALPHELTDAQREQAVKNYANHIVNRYSVACDYAIHRPDKKGDSRNHHAHILFTTRRITKDGFTEKTRKLDDKTTGAEEIKHLQTAWQDICNDALAEAQLKQRVDCRSLKEQGIQRLPEPKQGAVATKMERQGKISHAGDERRAVKAYNYALEAISVENDTDVAKNIITPSQAVKTADRTMKDYRRNNKRPAYWLYKQARYYLRVLLNRKRAGQHKHRLSAIWRHVSIVNIVQAVDITISEYQEATTDTELIYIME